jgi:2'-5' RNA ligase
MSGQFALFDDIPPPAPAPSRRIAPKDTGPNSLFFTLYVPAEAAQSIALRTRALVDELGLPASRILRADELHVSLLGLGSYDEPPGALVEAAKRAAATVAVEPFDIVFDRLAGFGRDGDAMVLQGVAGDQPVDGLHRALREAMTQAQVPWHSGFSAHMTLAYLQRPIEGRGIEPTQVPCADFALALSLRGRRHHEILGRWPLRA